MAEVCEASRKKRRRKVVTNDAEKKSEADTEKNKKQTPVACAIELISCGYSELTAVSAVQQQYSLPLEQAQAVVENAFIQIHSYFEDRPVKQKLSAAVEQRNRIAQKAIACEDLRVALSALDQRDKLLGLHDPETFEQTAACSTLLALIKKSINPADTHS